MIADAPVALIALPAPRLRFGLLKLNVLPPPIAIVVPAATLVVAVLVVVPVMVPLLPAFNV